MLSFLRFCLFYLLYIYYASSFSISLLTSVLSVLLNCSNNLFYIIFSYSTSTSNTSCSTCSIFIYDINLIYVQFYINFYINSCSTCSTFEFDITLICSTSTSLLTACSVCSILPAFLHLFSSVVFFLHELLMLLTDCCSLLFYLWLPRTPRYRT